MPCMGNIANLSTKLRFVNLLDLTKVSPYLRAIGVGSSASPCVTIELNIAGPVPQALLLPIARLGSKAFSIGANLRTKARLVGQPSK